MMLGFPPPFFFQICWRFVSPAIIFVSSWADLSLPLRPHGKCLSLGNQQRGSRSPSIWPELPWELHSAGHWQSEGGCIESDRYVEMQNHPGPGLGLEREHRTVNRPEDSTQPGREKQISSSREMPPPPSLAFLPVFGASGTIIDIGISLCQPH